MWLMCFILITHRIFSSCCKDLLLCVPFSHAMRILVTYFGEAFNKRERLVILVFKFQDHCWEGIHLIAG